MNIPFHSITPSHPDSDWIDCILDLSHPVIRPFSLSDLSRFQGVEPSNQGLNEPFLHHFRRVARNHSVKNDWLENNAILLAMANRLASDRDAASWAFLDALSGSRIAGNDRNAWRLAEALETLEMFALIAQEQDHWGFEELRELADCHIRSALMKVCEICRQPGMDSFDFLPTNKSLFKEPSVYQSCGEPGRSSFLLDAVPTSTYAKSIAIAVANNALEGSLVNELKSASDGLPIASQTWEEILKNILEVDMSTGKVVFQERWAEQSPIVSWDDMKNHRWNKFSPISIHDLEFVYDLGMAILPDLEGITDEARKDLMQMAAVLYGKLTVSNFDADRTSQVHVDCKAFFEQLPAHQSSLLGLDMFWHSKDTRQVIDGWIDLNADWVAGSLLSTYSGFDGSIPVGPNRLLGIIMLHSPIENPDYWFCYSLVRMSLLALSRAEALGISREGLALSSLRTKGSFGNWDRDYELPVLSEKLLKDLYLAMPPELQGTSAKVFLGLKISRQELMASNPALRDIAFGADMGL